MEARAIFGEPKKAFPLADLVRSALRARHANCVMRLGFPFVSRAGVEALVGPLQECEGWTEARKTWLVGVHQGVTEPAALQQISALPSSRVRIYTATGDLSQRAFRARPMFHAKVVAVETTVHAGRRPVLEAVILSSANLTRAAIGHGRANYEAGAVLSKLGEPAKSEWSDWWETAWADGLPLTLGLLDRYARLRDEFIKANPVVLDNADPPSTTTLTNSNTFWIDAGAMSGGSRNQVEFNRELAAFFGHVVTRRRKISVEIGRHRWDDRPLSPKVTTFGVEIWRLSLPTAASGGLAYPGKVIRFRRRPSHDSFLVDVADEDSRAARVWRSEANRSGYIGSTSGNRAFGFY